MEIQGRLKITQRGGGKAEGGEKLPEGTGAGEGAGEASRTRRTGGSLAGLEGVSGH